MSAIPDPRPEFRHDTSLVICLTLVAMCLFVIIWKRTSSLKSVVQHRLRTFTSSDGAIRLPADDDEIEAAAGRESNVP